MLLSACSYSDKQLINLAESMMDANPDSALYILRNAIRLAADYYWWTGQKGKANMAQIRAVLDKFQSL
jgi:hypothetical protein